MRQTLRRALRRRNRPSLAALLAPYGADLICSGCGYGVRGAMLTAPCPRCG